MEDIFSAKRVATNSLWLIAGYCSASLLVVVVGGWVVRYLGPQQYGELAMATSFVLLFVPFVSLGLDRIIAHRLVANLGGSDSEILRSGWWMSVVAAGVGIAGVPMIALMIWPDQNNIFVLTVICSLYLITRPSLVFVSWLNARMESRVAVSARVFAIAIASVLRIVLVYAQAPLFLFAWTFVIEGLVEAVILFGVFWRKFGMKDFFRWKRRLSASLLTDGWPMLLASVGVMVYMSIDQVMLGLMVDEYQVGIYAPAMLVLGFVSAVGVAITVSLFPLMVQLRRIDPARYDQHLKKIYRNMTWAAICVALILSVSAPWVVWVLFGDKYHQTAGIVSIVVWNCVFVYQGLLDTSWSVAERLQRHIYPARLCAAAANVLMNLWVIPRYGAIGAAVTTLISYGIATWGVGLFCAPLRPLWRYRAEPIVYLFRWIKP